MTDANVQNVGERGGLMPPTIPDEAPIQCRCGKVRGEVLELSRGELTHVRCYCADCRAFIRWLERDELLDEAGGFTILQVAPSRVRITAGADQIACLRLTPKGLHRFHTICCRSPVGNAVSARVPFIGLPVATLDVSTRTTLGTPTGINGSFEEGRRPPGHVKAPLRLMVRALWLLVRWWWTGKGQPSPYFSRTGEPCALPTILEPQERERLRGRERGVA